MSTSKIGFKGDCLFLMYGYALNDPPARQAAEFLARQGFQVHIVQISNSEQIQTAAPDSVTIHTVSPAAWVRKFGPLYNWYRWRCFVREVRRQLAKTKPQLVVTIMLHALAALPKPAPKKQFKLLSCIYDIPALEDAGTLDRRIIGRGWQRLKTADVVWASDIFKARLAQERGQLTALPVVCHNCPPLDYLPEPTPSRDGRLRAELRKQGAAIGETGGSILLRAGAVGECGGIEETLAGMGALPEDYIFVMLGRPPAGYKQRLLERIAELGLQRRAFLFDRPSDTVWKQALQGADIGHLIHGPFPPGRMKRQYDLNSSLSNNRLFQYMSAGLPIIVYSDPRMNNLYAEVPCFRVARLARLGDDIIAAWRELGRNAELRHQLGGAGRKAHQISYHWDNQFRWVLHMANR